MTKPILTQNYLNSILRYDPNTGELFWRIKISNVQAGDRAGGFCKTSGYIFVGIDYHIYHAHRLIWVMCTGHWPKEIDHENHIRHDNRWRNLREVTRQTNQRNASKRKDNTSGLTGVRLHKQIQQWTAQITVNRKQIHLGLFEEWWDAACARKAAENKFCFHRNHGKM